MEFSTKITDKQGYKYRRFQWPRAWRMAFTGKGKRVLPPGFNIWFYSLLLVLALAFPALASLPTYVQASGSGLAGFNGTYAGVNSSGASYTDNNGQPYYVLQSSSYTCYLYILNTGYGPGWFFDSTLDNAQGHFMTSPASSVSSPVGQTFTDSGGHPGPSVAVASPPPAPSIASFGASPSSVQPGSASSLSWSTSGAASVTLAAGNGAASSVSLSGSQSVSPAVSTVYTLTATSSGGTVSAQTTVTVLAPTVASLSASPASVPASGSQTVSLLVTLTSAAPPGGATVSFSGVGSGGYSGGIGWTPASVSVPYGSTTASVTATLTPSAPGSVVFGASYNSSSASATVAVGSAGSGGGGGSSSTVSGGLSLSPSPGASGQMSQGTVTLSSASSSAVIVSLTSTAPIVAGVPASVTIPAGATSATFPVTCGSLAVTGFTTISATLSNGVSQSLIYSVNPGVGGASGTLPDGQSTFTGGTGFLSGFPPLNFTAPTLPILPVLSGAPLPTLPTFTLPGIPALGAPGDLKIGIPGLGSIGIPSAWLTQIMQYAAEAAAVSTGMTGSVLTSGMQYAAMTTNLAVFDAGKAVKTSVDNGTYTLQQINSTQNTNTAALQNTANNNTSAIQGTLQQQTFAINTTATNTQNTLNTNFTSMLTAGPGGLLTQLFQYLFIPPQSTITQLQQCVQQFLNWGPYQLVTQVQTVLAAPTGQVQGAPLLPFAAQAPTLQTGMTANLSRPRVQSGTSPRVSSPLAAVTPVFGAPLPAAGTDLAIPLMVPVQSTAYTVGAGGITSTPTVTWTNTGQSVAFDFTPMTGSKFWPFFRLLEGASVWIIWLLGTMKRLMPRQVF